MTIKVTPETARFELQRLTPGEEVVFEPGTYDEVLKIELNNLRSNEPPETILRAKRGAEISMDISAEEFRVKGNRLAKEVSERPKKNNKKPYPGLWPYLMDGRLRLKNSRNIRIEGFKFERSWPTHVAISECQDVAIVDCEFLDATFAIGADGENTYGITIDRCTWLQDREPGRMWQKIPWWRIHGAVGDGYPPVDIQRDWRLFDGDFFRSNEIRGGVTIRNCRIGQAFNAIHTFNRPKDKSLSVDVNVHDCQFFEIRDNVLEVEAVATNWWFHRNQIRNAHKPFSIELLKGGAFYIFANLWWFDSVQGPQGYDIHRGGGMFKLRKKDPKEKLFPSYVFHNSIATRSDYIRKGLLAGLNHFNNAIWFPTWDDDDVERIMDSLPRIFGNLNAHPTSKHHTRDRFSTKWKDHSIKFKNDVMRHDAWPGILKKNGYGKIVAPPGADPKFRDPLKGDFRLQRRSPCRKKSIAAKITFPTGAAENIVGNRDVGAVQGRALFKGPNFRPM